jgi:hypothetical protein
MVMDMFRFILIITLFLMMGAHAGEKAKVFPRVVLDNRVSTRFIMLICSDLMTDTLNFMGLLYPVAHYIQEKGEGVQKQIRQPLDIT